MVVQKMMSSLGVCILVLLFGANNFSRAQKSAVAGKDDALAAKQLENVQIEAQSIGRLFADLSLSYDIPIGLEIALNDDESAIYHIDFKKGTLSELLTQFVARHDQYAWEITDGVVNVFPKDYHRDLLLEELLETKIGSFSIKEKTNCWTLVESLITTPEIKEILEIKKTTYRSRSFSGAYIPQLGRHFTLDVSNMQLKTILNKVTKESQTAKFWLITRNGNDQTLFIGLSARHEDFPPSNNKLSAPQQNVH